MHNMAEEIIEFAKAFLEAKKNMHGVRKNSKSNMHKYANLTSVYEAVESALLDQGIVIIHMAETINPDYVVLHTRLLHAASGQYMEDTRPLKCEKPGNQALGSANTYMRRYAVLSLCALSDESDDDGEDERKYIEKKYSSYKQKPTASPYVTTSQVQQIQNELEQFDNAQELEETIQKAFGINTWQELPADKFSTVIDYIRK